MKHTADRLPEHSKHKVEFYRQYLASYFSILFNVPGRVIDTIWIIETHCGAGKYGDDEGSTLVLAKELNAAYNKFLANNSSNEKQIKVFINDKIHENVESAYAHIQNQIPSSIKVEKRTKDVGDFLVEIGNYTFKQKMENRKERFLMFIDPYGYKEISPESLSKIALSGNTDILLFMPIEEMYRFVNAAANSHGANGMGPLKDLVSKVNLATGRAIPYKSKLDFYKTFCEYLKFNDECYSSFMMIERENGFNAMFFVSHQWQAQLKINEVRWRIDPIYGIKYEYNQVASSLYREADTTNLERLVVETMKSKFFSNLELFELAIRAGYLPKHISSIVKKYIDNGCIVRDPILELNSKALYISEKEFKSKTPKLLFKWRTAE